jgi:hypothetical protein
MILKRYAQVSEFDHLTEWPTGNLVYYKDVEDMERELISARLRLAEYHALYTEAKAHLDRLNLIKERQ